MATVWQTIRRALSRAKCPDCQPVAPHGVNRERFDWRETR